MSAATSEKVAGLAEDLRELAAAVANLETTCSERHCDDGDCDPCLTCEDRDEGAEAELRQVVERWHEDEHRHAFKFCEHPVCIAMGRLAIVRHD